MTEKTSLLIAGDTINYDYDTNINKVDFVFTMAPGTLMTRLIIKWATSEPSFCYYNFPLLFLLAFHITFYFYFSIFYFKYFDI